MSRWKSLLTSSSFVQVESAIQPMYPLVIPSVPPSTQHFEQLAEAIGWVAFSGALKRRNHRFVPGGIRSIPVHRVTDASDSAGSTKADAMSLLEVIHQFSSNSRLYSFFSITSFSSL
jgi:hypothetical protein